MGGGQKNGGNLVFQQGTMVVSKTPILANFGKEQPTFIVLGGPMFGEIEGVS